MRDNMSKKLVQFWEDPEVITVIDETAKYQGKNRSTFIRESIRMELRRSQSDSV
jgi:metal-responsive CopG/Arc/MetJ family transcriptional regulator